MFPNRARLLACLPACQAVVAHPRAAPAEHSCRQDAPALPLWQSRTNASALVRSMWRRKWWPRPRFCTGLTGRQGRHREGAGQRTWCSAGGCGGGGPTRSCVGAGRGSEGGAGAGGRVLPQRRRRRRRRRQETSAHPRHLMCPPDQPGDVGHHDLIKVGAWWRYDAQLGGQSGEGIVSHLRICGPQEPKGRVDTWGRACAACREQQACAASPPPSQQGAAPLLLPPRPADRTRGVAAVSARSSVDLPAFGSPTSPTSAKSLSSSSRRDTSPCWPRCGRDGGQGKREGGGGRGGGVMAGGAREVEGWGRELEGHVPNVHGLCAAWPTRPSSCPGPHL